MFKILVILSATYKYLFSKIKNKFYAKHGDWTIKSKMILLKSKHRWQRVPNPCILAHFSKFCPTPPPAPAPFVVLFL